MGAQFVPHVVIFPYDEHGHVTPAFALGRALARRGIRATGVLTATRYASVISTMAAPDQSDLFNIVAIPDVSTYSEEISDGGSDKQLADVCYHQSLQKLERGFEELILQLQPRPVCLISDILFPWSQDIADRHGIPRFHIWVFPAIVPLVLSYTPALYGRSLLPFQPGTENVLVDFIPGLPKLFRLMDVPNDFLSRDEQQLEFLFWIVRGMKRAVGALINTVYELEPEVVNTLAAELGVKVYTLGSMSSLESATSTDAALSSSGLQNGTRITDCRDDCLKWLDTLPLASAVYVALGSIVSFTQEEVREMALGLEACGQPFLWVLRRPTASNGHDTMDPMTALPDGFLERTTEKGRVIGWAPQTAVLAHPAVGCFLTHCGMGSLLEALLAGVPMICGFCKISDQNTNMRLLTQELGVAIPLLPPASSHINIPHPDLSSCLVSCVNEVIRGGRGQALRRNAVQLKATLNAAVSAPHGSSYVNLTKLANAITNASILSPAEQRHAA